MPKLILRGTFIRFIDLRYDEKSKTPYTKINFTADFSDPVREALEWGEPAAGFTSGDLEGEYTASHLILTPNGKELRTHEIQINAQSIGDFSFHHVKGREDEGEHDELRFQVVTSDPEAPLKLRDYIAAIGKGEAQLRVNYEQQESLDISPGKSDDADDEERLISKEQAEDTMEDEPRVDGPTLAPRVLVEGNKPKRRSIPPRDRSREAVADGTAPLEPVN